MLSFQLSAEVATGQVNAFIFLSNNDWAQIKDSDEMAHAVNKQTIETFWLFFLNIIWISF